MEFFLQNVMELEQLLAKPAFLAAGGEETSEVLVPRLPKDLKGKKGKCGFGQATGESGDDAPISKKAVMRKKATMAAIAAAEAAAIAEQAKRVADAAKLGASQQLAEGEQVICEICLFSEVAGSKKAERLMCCPSCKRNFHRNCLKRWAGNRDLFNWSSWVCGACRTCEVCRRTGEPNKLMFCKRCDAAIHAYCQQPPLKHVPKGPFLCPKHTMCHGCGSRVPGSGVSSRWFLEYTMCDACGRLFIKGKYCSICLKVYRDSESSPMVCCDSCEHWVHACCDKISDDKYYEFQLDNNLRYTCAACRGDCYKVRGTSDAVEELWRRRDEADRDLIRENQVLAGLPSREKNMKLCPSDDDYEVKEVEENMSKKTFKALTAKGEKPSAEFGSHKRTADEVDKSAGNGTIKRLKITLPGAHLSKSKESQHQAPEAVFSVSENNRPSSVPFSGNFPPKKNKSVARMAKYMVHARESMGAGNGKISTVGRDIVRKAHVPVHLLNEMAEPLNGFQVNSERSCNYNKNTVKSVKFVDNSKIMKETSDFLLPQASKKGFSKSDIRSSPSSATTADDHMQSYSSFEEFRSDDYDGSEHNNDFSQNLRNIKFARMNKPLSLLKGNERTALGHHLPSFKYRDKQQELRYDIDDSLIAGDLDSNDTSSGFTRCPMGVSNSMDAMHGASQDDDSMGSLERKRNLHSDGNRVFSSRHKSGNAIRGQRSKRRKHSAFDAQKAYTLELGRHSSLEGGKIMDNNRILHNLRIDSAGKKVRMFLFKRHEGRDSSKTIKTSFLSMI
ncbi:hypothetical protein KP509_02G090500 [Ceratopteris richardii]|uniref:PHD-type domain-containing protein n=1 Tax=Ceratopteris richardii TaxID=49495 RepID=A0A8T2VCG4_CERRI|nr:hypothetical protein KP509_02G090500 [Ceratopteris richardii]